MENNGIFRIVACCAGGSMKKIKVIITTGHRRICRTTKWWPSHLNIIYVCEPDRVFNGRILFNY